MVGMNSLSLGGFEGAGALSLVALKSETGIGMLILSRTLQELIAPSYIIFFDQQWNPLGPRGDLYGLFSQIVEVTGIPLEILDHTTEVNEIPVAQRFSWAADRETTRIEDIAYCLLGIFDVNMPMLYGEGPKAFLRLQEQILAQSADLSLFLWTIDSQEDFSGLLATSPACFREMKHVAVEPSFTQREFYLTNRGIRFKMGLAWDPNTGLAIMPVKHIVSYTDSPVGIQLRRVGLDTFVRARPGDFTIVSSLRQFDTFTVVKDLTHRQAEHLKRNTLMIDASRDIMITEVEPKGSWAPDSQHLHPSYTGAFLGYMVFQKYQFPTFTVVFWFHRGLWSASVVQADEWARIRRDFYQHYKNRTPALGGDLGRPILSSISNAKESNILIHAVRRVEDEKHGRRWTMAIRSEGSVERRVLP